VKEQKALENLTAPVPQYVGVDFLEPANITI